MTTSDDDDADPHHGLSRRHILQASAGLIAANSLANYEDSPLISEVGAQPVSAATAATTPERYVLRRLKELGVTKIFGVPGKTCEALYEVAAAEGMAVVVTASDLEAGYAADGYARVSGLGAVAVTYGVGTSSLANAVAGAYAERSSVVVINGGPGAEDLRNQRELKLSFTHSIGRRRPDGASPTDADMLTDLAIFSNITAFAKRAATGADVPKVVDDALTAALQLKRPAYIEISKDAWGGACSGPNAPLATRPPAAGTEQAIATEILRALRAARSPLVVLGIEIARYGLQGAATALVNKLGLPWTTTMLAKSAIPESTPGFIGVYDGAYAPPFVRKVVDETDLFLMLGTMFGVQYRPLLTRPRFNAIRASEDEARFSSPSSVRACNLSTLVAQLNAKPFEPSPNWRPRPVLGGLSFDKRRESHGPRRPAVLPGERGMTYEDAMRSVSDMLDDTLLTITDTSLSMYTAADLNIIGAGGFFCNALWQSIGYSAGAAVGAGLAPNGRRPVVVCGDGGFQMMVQTLSTLARNNIRAIVVVLDNGFYAIEQWLIELGSPDAYHSKPNVPQLPFLTLQPWQYETIAAAMGFEVANARKVETAAELKIALTDAKAATKPFFIRALMKPHDLPAELRPPA